MWYWTRVNGPHYVKGVRVGQFNAGTGRWEFGPVTPMVMDDFGELVPCEVPA